MASDLTLPASEQVDPGSTTDLSGISFNDSFAAGNPGDLHLSITDANGELAAADSAGAVSGSGTNSITLDATYITLDATYADVQAILSSLAYVAPNSDTSDAISFDIWDQAGVETTGTIPVAVSGGGGTSVTWTGAANAMTQQDLAPTAPAPAAPADPVPASASTGVAMLNDTNGAPIGMPLNFNH